MQLVKNGFGKAKHYADLAKVHISLMTKSLGREDLLDKYLTDYEAMKRHLTPFTEKYGTELLFNNYFAGRKDKTVEITKDSKKEFRSEFEYFYVNGSFNMDIPIVDNDRHAISELISLISELSSEISYSIEFTLSAKTISEVRAKATNNALDNIRIEVEQIAKHLGKHKIELDSLEFNDGGVARTGRMSKQISSPSERERILDEMLESKEIEVESTFVSMWSIE